MTQDQTNDIAPDAHVADPTTGHAPEVAREPATGPATGPATYTMKEACAIVGLTRDAWASWQKRGLLPMGTIGTWGEHNRRVRLFTQAEVDAARAAVQQTEPATAEHTISPKEAARMLGISASRLYDMQCHGLFPPGRWAPPDKATGTGGRRKLYTPAEIEQARAALAGLMNRRPEIDGQEAMTLQDAAALIGLTRAQWRAWQDKGWAPKGKTAKQHGTVGGNAQIYTRAQINELKSSLERGEHPGACQIATEQHTITKEEAASQAGVCGHAWHELSQRGQLPEGRWGPNPKGSGKGGSRTGGLRKLYTPEDVEALKVAMRQLEDERRPTIDGKPALTVLEACEKINISRPLWYDWCRRGWLPKAHRVARSGGGQLNGDRDGQQMMNLYTPEQIEALKASIDRGEHPGVQGRGTAEHTITRAKAAKMLGITVSMWSTWEKEGIVPKGVQPPLSPTLGSGGSKHVWTPAQVEEVRRKATERGILEPAATPEHTLTRADAAALVGISEATWTYWCRRGVVPRGCRKSPGKGAGNGGYRRMHSHEEVRQARAALDEIGFGRGPNATEAHTLTQREAARMLGVEPRALQNWEKRGLMPMGAWARATKGPALRKMYTPAQVEEARAALKSHSIRCFDRATHEHTYTRQQAARFIGVPFSTWTHWEHQQRTPVGAWAPAAKGSGRCKLFTRAELQAFADELEKLHKPYADPDRPGVHRVPIRTGKGRMEALIDSADLRLVEGKHWNYSEKTDDYGTYGVVVLSTAKGRMKPLKQYITGVSGVRWRIRHANGDFLDCRRENLVVLDIAQQSYGNKKIKMRAGYETTSKYKGVCWDEDRGKWLAQIRKDGVHRHLGRFDDEIDAADAYDNAARELFGEHAYLNFDGVIDRTEEQRSAA